VTLLRQPDQNRTVVHVLHYLPQRRHPGFDTLEDVIPIHNVQLRVRLDHPASAAYLAPSRQPLDFVTEGGCACVTVPEVSGHAMVVFEE
jgi:hypothetical protein